MTDNPLVKAVAKTIFPSIAKAHDFNDQGVEKWDEGQAENSWVFGQAMQSATAALRAIEDAGWKVVPVQATPEMQRAFTDAALRGSVHGAGGWHGYAREQWGVMIGAAPNPTAAPSREDQP